jgi:hypothetical protein
LLSGFVFTDSVVRFGVGLSTVSRFAQINQLFVCLIGFDSEVAIHSEKGLTTICSNVDGVGDTTGLIAIYAPHPWDDMKGHAFAQDGRFALFQTADIAFIPTGRKGNADGLP